MIGAHQALACELAVIEARLACALATPEALDDALARQEAALVALPAKGPARHIAARLGLTSFERDLLLLAAAVHLSPPIAAQIRLLAGQPVPQVTAAMAISLLPNADWRALRPDAALRALRCIRLADPDRPTHSELLVDERILLALLGQDALDERLAALVQPVTAHGGLAAGAQLAADRLVERWHALSERGAPPVIQLRQEEGQYGDAVAIAADIAARTGRHLYVMAPANLPPTPAERHGFAALWRRERQLANAALLIALPDDPAPDQLALVADLVDRLDDLIIVTGQGGINCRRNLIGETILRPDRAERQALWVADLGQDMARRLNGVTEALAEQFELNASDIRRLSGLARGMSTAEAKAWLHESARATALTHISTVADVIRPKAGWDDLILPDDLMDTLKAMVAQVSHRRQVHDDWGFAQRGARGLGIAALFAGPSGTGKTFAAEVIAHALSTDLIRVDLAGVVSKYIGETEKNLKRVFAAAEGSGAVLLFDEADALFGKRSEVANAHDRYANIEVGYLLQRMENYTGLTILTTNQREALDGAFFRRLRFVLQFPFPDQAMREKVWARAFPAAAATEQLDCDRLARLNVTPGNIRTIAINAAFLAASESSAVGMRHLHDAALSECRKLERPVTAIELGGWL